MKEVMSSVFILMGSTFVFIAALGVLRMPELYMRIHSSTKAGTLGVGLILLGVALHFQELSITVRTVATITFIILTAPVAAHIIGRAGYRIGVPLWKGTLVNEISQEEKWRTHENN